MKTRPLPRRRGWKTCKADEARATFERSYDPVGAMRAAYAEDDVRAAQLELERLGCDTGPVNGAFTTEMEASLRAFQRDHGLRPHGALDARTKAALAASAASAARRTTR